MFLHCLDVYPSCDYLMCKQLRLHCTSYDSLSLMGTKWPDGAAVSMVAR